MKAPTCFSSPRCCPWSRALASAQKCLSGRAARRPLRGPMCRYRRASRARRELLQRNTPSTGRRSRLRGARRARVGDDGVEPEGAGDGDERRREGDRLEDERERAAAPASFAVHHVPSSARRRCVWWRGLPTTRIIPSPPLSALPMTRPAKGRHEKHKSSRTCITKERVFTRGQNVFSSRVPRSRLVVFPSSAALLQHKKSTLGAHHPHRGLSARACSRPR